MDHWCGQNTGLLGQRAPALRTRYAVRTDFTDPWQRIV